MHVVPVEAALLHHALALLGQLAEHWAQVLAQLGVQGRGADSSESRPRDTCTPIGCGLSSRCLP